MTNIVTDLEDGGGGNPRQLDSVPAARGAPSVVRPKLLAALNADMTFDPEDVIVV
jgi:hypothetical protein